MIGDQIEAVVLGGGGTSGSCDRFFRIFLYLGWLSALAVKGDEVCIWLSVR